MASCTCHVLGGTKRLRLERIVRLRTDGRATKLLPNRLRHLQVRPK